MFSGGFPFFGFGGGGQQDGEGMQQENPKEVDNTTLYKDLGLQKTATIDQIKKAYRKMAMKYHPDKPQGSAEKFKVIKDAYQILSNPEKKDLYDKYGKEGVQAGGNPRGGGFSSFFDMFGGGGQKQKGPVKGKPKLIKLEVTLQEVYQGCTKQVKHTRSRVCQSCQGKGGKNKVTCQTCKGRKVVEKMIQLGPGMYTSSRSACNACKGQGYNMAKQDICKVCKGQMIVQQQKSLDVAIEQGCPHQKDYIFTGESDQYPGIMAADLYVRVFIKKHDTFQRKGADLFIKKKISLLQALTGVQFDIKHLDGKIIRVKSFQGETITPNSFKTLKRLGMPLYKNVISNGNLYVHFEVEFPKKINKEAASKLRQVLPGPPKSTINVKKDDVHMLQDFDQSELNSHQEGGKAQEEQDEGMHGGQRVQCAQQ